MGLLRGKKVLLGVSGSIAAYKSAFTIREFIKQGAEVQVICTPMSLQFVTALTLGTLSKRPVLHDLVREPETGVWTNHVELGLWADLMVIAPASANTLAKMAHGDADNLLLTTYLSARCPVYFAPAMDHDMHGHPANAQNIRMLESRGNIHIPSATGELASGLEGQGRMAEPEEIVAHIESYLSANAPLKGIEVLVTAGPTYEAIDPVRFIGNRSSGKMGYALAERAASLGAEVTLVSGPVHLPDPHGVKTIRVESAEEMYRAASEAFETCRVAIFAAAVADYRPAHVAGQKIKKDDGVPAITLEPTTDILRTLAKNKGQRIVVGFALETENELQNAQTKLERKNADAIILNSLRDEGAGFGVDTNRVTLLTRNKTQPLELMSKSDTAAAIIDFITADFL